jgi:hypothetical protein
VRPGPILRPSRAPPRRRTRWSRSPARQAAHGRLPPGRRGGRRGPACGCLHDTHDYTRLMHSHASVPGAKVGGRCNVRVAPVKHLRRRRWPSRCPSGCPLASLGSGARPSLPRPQRAKHRSNRPGLPTRSQLPCVVYVLEGGPGGSRSRRGEFRMAWVPDDSDGVEWKVPEPRPPDEGDHGHRPNRRSPPPSTSPRAARRDLLSTRPPGSTGHATRRSCANRRRPAPSCRRSSRPALPGLQQRGLAAARRRPAPPLRCRRCDESRQHGALRA